MKGRYQESKINIARLKNTKQSKITSCGGLVWITIKINLCTLELIGLWIVVGSNPCNRQSQCCTNVHHTVLKTLNRKIFIQATCFLGFSLHNSPSTTSWPVQYFSIARQAFITGFYSQYFIGTNILLFHFDLSPCTIYPWFGGFFNG